MQDFIDLKGASGAEYRFRVWAEGAAHLPIAGNYAILKVDEEGVSVLLIGATNDLSQARKDWSRVAKRSPTHIFTRLNVARATREAEHADLTAGYKSALASDGT
jgi:hypothetical protein